MFAVSERGRPRLRLWGAPSSNRDFAARRSAPTRPSRHPSATALASRPASALWACLSRGERNIRALGAEHCEPHHTWFAGIAAMPTPARGLGRASGATLSAHGAPRIHRSVRQFTHPSLRDMAYCHGPRIPVDADRRPASHAVVDDLTWRTRAGHRELLSPPSGVRRYVR